MLTYSQWQRPLLALVAILLGFFSFYWARQHPEYAWDAPIMMIGAALFLWLALRRPATPTPDSDVKKVTPAPAPAESGGGVSVPVSRWLDSILTWRAWLVGVALFLTMVLLNSLAGPPRDTYLPQFLMWLGAIVVYTIAITPPRALPRYEWGMWWEVNRRTAIIVAVIVLGAFLLRAWDLTNIPSTVGGDEASQGLESIKILKGEIRNPFTTGWLGVPTMSFFYNAITIGPLGNTIFALRLPWAVIGTATVLVFFWLTTRLHGVKFGLVAAALLGAYHFHIHFSRLGSNQVADPFFIALQLLFLYRGRARHSALDFILAGVTVGVAQYFYAGARLTMIMLGVMLVHFIWLDRHRADTLKRSLQNALIAAVAFLITAAPMLQYAVRFPNDYNARLNQVGVFQNGWIDGEIARRGVSVFQLLFEQGQRAFLMFNYYPDRTVWYGTPNPAMEGIWAVLFLVGLLYCSLRLLPPRSENRFFPFVLWWWTGMVLGGVLTESPPSYQRMVTLAVPAVYFVSYVLYRIVQIFRNVLPRRETRFAPIALTVMVLILSALSIQWYFIEFTPLNVYGSRNGAIATSMGKWLAANLEDEQRPVFLGPPVMYIGFGTIPYLEPRAAQGIDVHQPLTEPPTNATFNLPPGVEPLFFILPGRSNELTLLEQGYPGGERTEIKFHDGSILYWIYEP
jgi:4-amino-4-deoxy-L-arabinose transferase-like glycosyltransferase